MKKMIPMIEIKKKYFYEIKDMIDIVNILAKDINQVIEVSNKKINELKYAPESTFLDEQETWFRLSNRLVITVIESMCYKIKQTALLICDTLGKPLTEKEREKLTEKKTDGSNLFLKTSENVKFSFDKLAYAFDINFKIKYGEEWSNFLKVIRKRNALTHPKTKADLKITVTEHNKSAETINWFYRTLETFFDELKKQRNVMMKLHVNHIKTEKLIKII
jgi:hypothetical protein